MITFSNVVSDGKMQKSRLQEVLYCMEKEMSIIILGWVEDRNPVGAGRLRMRKWKGIYGMVGGGRFAAWLGKAYNRGAGSNTT